MSKKKKENNLVKKVVSTETEALIRGDFEVLSDHEDGLALKFSEVDPVAKKLIVGAIILVISLLGLSAGHLFRFS